MLFVVRLLNSGVGPNENIGDIYSWEEWPHDRWPNIIMLEFSINARPKENSVMARLIAHLEDKYRQAGVEYLPAFMFLDLFNLQVLMCANTLSQYVTFVRRLSLHHQHCMIALCVQCSRGGVCCLEIMKRWKVLRMRLWRIAC